MTETIEQEIVRKGLTAPRITREYLEQRIVGEDSHVFPETCLTVVCLTLANGFTVTGESACASPENFDLGLGLRIARENAVNKIWPLEGYLLREKLATTPSDAKGRAIVERDELAARLAGLESFFATAAFALLETDQRMRLSSQAQYMRGYYEVLAERIVEWKP